MKKKYFCFIDNLNDNIIKNIKKFNNLSIIYRSKDNLINEKNIQILNNFCKKNKIQFYINNNFRLAHKYKTTGVFLTSTNKKLGNLSVNKKLKIIGSAHNQFEYYIKTMQGCETIMLSPLFYNKKYSLNKILGICRFNLISNNWKKKICALGGLNNNNLKKLRIINGNAAAFISLIENSLIKKKPPYI
jgi:thiamine monophosphate synthase